MNNTNSNNTQEISIEKYLDEFYKEEQFLNKDKSSDYYYLYDMLEPTSNYNQFILKKDIEKFLREEKLKEEELINNAFTEAEQLKEEKHVNEINGSSLIKYYYNNLKSYSSATEEAQKLINQIGNTLLTHPESILNINSSNTNSSINSINTETYLENNMFPVLEELLALNGLLDQHPTTGKYISAAENDGFLYFNYLGYNDSNYKSKLVDIIKSYRNKLFGAPFQFLDSVDARFSSTNKFVGYEFLRNFLLHSAILHIYPGNTKYTGGNDSKFKSITNIIKSLAMDASRNNSNESKSYTNLYQGWARVYGEFEKLENTKGAIEQEILKLFMRSKLQRRLFGISFQYESYLRYVKLMCHGVALLLKLTGSTYLQGEYPNGTFVNPYSKTYSIDEIDTSNDKLNLFSNLQDLISLNGFTTFKNINWGNYRMIEDSSTIVQEIELTAKNAMDQITSILNQFDPSAFSKLGEGGKDLAWNAIRFAWSASPVGAWKVLTEAWSDGRPDDSFFDNLNQGWKNYFKKLGEIGTEGLRTLGNMAKDFQSVLQEYTELRYDIAERVQSIEFMVEPVNATESYQNDVGPSRLKSSVDSINGLGAEISFITNSGATTGLANTIITGGKEVINEAFNTMAQIATPFTGNFISNLFSGAIGAVAGNRFIYPDIYQNSNSHAEYNFKVNLSSPYGDIYNYYMNIVVPLCHLQALCLPRLKTSNSINSPFMVRAFIPGLMTCEMGIIDSMNVTKNPQNNRVSVNNFPLDVQVTFSIRELYHNLAISPTDDGLSYINNETLKDYLCNLAGIYPTFNREIELNLSAADMLESQFNLWEQIQRNGSASFLSFLGLLN